MEQLRSINDLTVAGEARKETEETIQYIVIRLGEEQYGIDISLIDNIVRMQRITRVPKAQNH